MTKDEALKELHDCLRMETETAHSWADQVLCKFLEAQGYDDLVKEYNKIEKWFA